PATTSMFASVRECVVHTNQRASAKKIWFFYIENYVRSLALGLIMVPLWAIWLSNIYFFVKEDYIAMAIPFLLFGIFYFVYNVLVFIVNVHYHFKFIDLFINTLFIAFGSVKLFLSIVIGFIFVISLTLLLMNTVF